MNERRSKIILRLRHLCRKSTKLVCVIDEDIDELIRNQKELVEFGALCQRMSAISYELAVTGEVDEDLLMFIRKVRKTEECDHARRWIGKLEDGLGNALYVKEHQKQQTLGEYEEHCSNE